MPENETPLEKALRLTPGRKYVSSGQRCDMIVGWSEDITGAPVMNGCPETHVKYIREFGLFGLFLCDEHFKTEVKRLKKEAKKSK